MSVAVLVHAGENALGPLFGRIRRPAAGCTAQHVVDGLHNLGHFLRNRQTHTNRVEDEAFRLIPSGPDVAADHKDTNSLRSKSLSTSSSCQVQPGQKQAGRHPLLQPKTSDSADIQRTGRADATTDQLDRLFTSFYFGQRRCILKKTSFPLSPCSDQRRINFADDRRSTLAFFFLLFADRGKRSRFFCLKRNNTKRLDGKKGHAPVST